MSFIIFCNSCFETREQVMGKCFITSCSHVFCNSCLNNTNFCRVCNLQCRIMQIEMSMPSEVKLFFEDSSIEKITNNANKIRTFQESQMQMFNERFQKDIQAKYSNYKKSLADIHDTEQRYNEGLRKENRFVEHLKDAYRSKEITPKLFTINSGFVRPDQSVASSSQVALRRSKGVPNLNAVSNHSRSSAGGSIASASSVSCKSLVNEMCRMQAQLRVPSTSASKSRASMIPTPISKSKAPASQSSQSLFHQQKPQANIPPPSQLQKPASQYQLPEFQPNRTGQNNINVFETLQKMSHDKYRTIRLEQLRKH